jgi:hypothetical protein
MPVAEPAEISDLPPALRGRQAPARTDALADLPRGAVAVQLASAMPASRPAGSAPVAQCYECAHVRHSKCARTAGTGPCLCYQCHRVVIIASATRALQFSSDPRVLSAALQETLILLAQRARRARRDSTEPYPARQCACGCGRPVVKTASTGTRKRYATQACVNRASKRRYRARKRDKPQPYILVSSFDTDGRPLPGTVAPLA